MRVALTILLLALLLTAAWLGWSLLLPKAPHGETFVLLQPGWPVRRIAAELESAGVIRSRRAFLLLHFGSGRGTLKAGEYRFSESTNARRVYQRLVQGDIHFYAVVIPEGFNMFEVAQVLETTGLGTRQEFLDIARGGLDLIEDLDPAATTLEGYLFPDTYRFTRTQSHREMIATMVRRFRQTAHALGLESDFRRIVTMASIVEKETRIPEERPIVASVFYNRLTRNMPLAADPTVIYAAMLADRYRGTIFRSDLQFDSPYNTYRYPGLPPGPIANPGREALRAAMQPASTPYLYFVSDAQGRHRFARTYEEHSRNVAAYRRALTTDSQ